MDENTPPSIAAVVYDPCDGSCRCIVAVVPDELLAQWGDKQQKIAQVELCAVLTGMTELASVMRGRDIVWFEDNAVVLASLVKGNSTEPSIDNGCAVVHLALEEMRCRIWFE